LQQDGEFSNDRPADRIALLAIYVPRLRQELNLFVHLWNTHRIRKQTNRPNTVPGKPVMLFSHPPEGRQDYGIPVPAETIDDLSSTMPGWDIEAYLPQTTREWCDNFLQLIGYQHDQTLTTDDHRIQPCYTAYTQLRSAVQNYINSGQEPRLGTLVTPTQARLQLLQEHDLLHAQEVVLETDVMDERGFTNVGENDFVYET
jgi:hypothetical protein